MHPLAVPCLAMGAINAYLALYHLTLALLRPQAREHLPFAVLCASVAAYDGFCVGLYNAESLAEGLGWQRLQLHMVSAIAMATIWFVARLTGTERSKGARRFLLWFAVLAPVSWLQVPGWTVSIETPAIKHIAWAGRPLITYHESSVGAVSTLGIASAFIAYAYVVVVLIRYYRARHTPAVLAILVGNLAYFLGVTNDSLVASEVYSFIYVSEYAFLLVNLAMAYVLLGRFVGLQRDVEALNVNLEHTVTQRTAALQASLEQQRAMQQQLVEASRRSGRADAAIAVLHNVGNALNSVNVSVDLLEGALRQSRLPGLGKVARMLSEQRGDLPGFFAADPRARQLPDYLVASTARIEAEHAALAGELGELRRHVDHIKLVVAVQQSYAGAPAVAQRTALAAVLDDAVAASQARHAGGPVAIERSYAAVPEVDIDRHKLLEVLGGLLDRAWHALDQAPADRRIRVRLSAPDAERAQIEIEDSGGGIPADGLVRMFQPDATGGGVHGDLHASACAAGELGGSLVAASDGPGLGARFTLTLPLRPRPTAGSIAPPASPA